MLGETAAKTLLAVVAVPAAQAGVIVNSPSHNPINMRMIVSLTASLAIVQSSGIAASGRGWDYSHGRVPKQSPESQQPIVSNFVSRIELVVL